MDATQLKSAVKAFISENEEWDDALETCVDNPRLQVRSSTVFDGISRLLAQARNATGNAEDKEFCIVTLLAFRAALLRAIAVSFLTSDNHVFERDGRKRYGPEAIEAYKAVLEFSEGYYVLPDTLYQLGWLSKAIFRRDDALRYFRELIERFPDDSQFTGLANLRISELEDEASSTSSTGFAIGDKWGAQVHWASVEVRLAPLSCLQESVRWLLSAKGLHTGRQLRSALGVGPIRTATIGRRASRIGLVARRLPFGEAPAGRMVLLMPGRFSRLLHAVAVSFDDASGEAEIFDPRPMYARRARVGRDIVTRLRKYAVVTLAIDSAGHAATPRTPIYRP